MGIIQDILNRRGGHRPRTALEMADYAVDLLEKQTEALFKPREEKFRWEAFAVSTGTSQLLTMEASPPGVTYTCERLAASCLTPGTAASVEVYLDEIQQVNLVEVITLNARGFYADAFSNDLFIPSNRALLLNFSGIAVGNTIAASIQVKREVIEAKHHAMPLPMTRVA